MGRSHRLLVALISTLAFAHGANAIEEPWRDKAGVEATSTGISREAKNALVCQVISDWSAFQVTQLIRDDAKENQAVDPQGIEILRQIRLTEGLASVAFEKLAPEADHDAMYQDAVAKMRIYLNEDRKGADTNAKRTVAVCQQTYRKMASEGASPKHPTRPSTCRRRRKPARRSSSDPCVATESAGPCESASRRWRARKHRAARSRPFWKLT